MRGPPVQIFFAQRTRDIIIRSRLVAAPLRYHAKKHVLCANL